MAMTCKSRGSFRPKYNLKFFTGLFKQASQFYLKMSAFSLFDTLLVQEDDEDIFMSTIDLNVNELNWNVNHLNLLCNHSGVIPRMSNQTVTTAVSNAKLEMTKN